MATVRTPLLDISDEELFVEETKDQPSSLLTDDDDAEYAFVNSETKDIEFKQAYVFDQKPEPPPPLHQCSIILRR